MYSDDAMYSDDELQTYALETVQINDESARAVSDVDHNARVAGLDEHVYCTVFAGRWNYRVELNPYTAEVVKVTRQ